MIMKLDFASNSPIYQQIRDQIVQAVADGIFANGDRLPTIRSLAQEVGINTMTVNKAYQLLKQEGYIITDRRNGAVVQCAGRKKEAVEKQIRESLELIVSEAKIGGITQEEFINICKILFGKSPS